MKYLASLSYAVAIAAGTGQLLDTAMVFIIAFGGTLFLIAAISRVVEENYAKLRAVMIEERRAAQPPRKRNFWS